MTFYLGKYHLQNYLYLCTKVTDKSRSVLPKKVSIRVSQDLEAYLIHAIPEIGFDSKK